MIFFFQTEERVKALVDFDLPDDQPVIEGPSITVNFESSVDYNFADNKAFESKWGEEIEKLKTLRETLFK